MQAATKSAAYRGLIGAELMFARLNVNGRQRTKSPLIYFLDATVKIDAPSLSNDISWDSFPIQRELRSIAVIPSIFTGIRGLYTSTVARH